MDDLLTIGRFSQLTGLSPKALRLYHEHGLLTAEVDAGTGYRRYRAEQAERAQLLRLLRAAGFSLAAIAELLADEDAASVRARLRARREELDAERRGRERALARLERLYGGGPDGAVAILAAAKAGDVEAVRRLLAADPTLVDAADGYDKTPLHLAAEHDHAAVAELLLDARADLEAETSWGATPLAWAATLGSAAAGGVLLARGARVDLASAAGLGLLDAARAFWTEDGLLADGAGRARFAEDEDGRLRKLAPPADEQTIVSDALYAAARNGHVDVVRFLLERGADVDFRGFFGAPGLHWAAINGHEDAVRFLLAAGADPGIRDEEFDADALGWAREGGHERVVALLAGA